MWITKGEIRDLISQTITLIHKMEKAYEGWLKSRNHFVPAATKNKQESRRLKKGGSESRPRGDIARLIAFRSAARRLVAPSGKTPGWS